MRVGQFKPLGDVKGIGYTKDAVWLWFQLQNSSEALAQLYVEIAYPVQNQTDFFVVENGELRTHVESGQNRPRDTKLWSLENPHMSYDLSANSKADVFVQIKSSTSINVTTLVWDRQTLLNAEVWKRFWFGIFYGGILALILYNVFLAITTRERVYVIYVAYLLSLIFFYGGWNGLGNVYLWGHHPILSPAGVSVGWSLMIATVLSFAIEFLDLPRHSKKIGRVLRAGSIAALAVFFIALIRPEATLNPFLLFVNSGSIILMLYVGVTLSLRGIRQAKFFLASWLILLASGIHAALSIVGVFEQHAWSPYVVQGSTLLEAVLFSIGLGDKINTERRQRITAQRETIESLERIVKISGGIAHELNNPLGIIQLTLNKIAKVASKQIADTKVNEMMQEDKKRIEIALGRISFVVKAVGTISGELTHPVEASGVKTILENALTRFKETTGYTGKLAVQVPDKAVLRCQIQHVEEAVLQMLKNAFDATVAKPGEGEILLEARVENDDVVVDVKDNGPGVKPGFEKKVFDPFMTTKDIGRGFGLGLNIILGVADLHRGSFSLERANLMTVARLRLPGIG